MFVPSAFTRGICSPRGRSGSWVPSTARSIPGSGRGLAQGGEERDAGRKGTGKLSAFGSSEGSERHLLPGTAVLLGAGAGGPTDRPSLPTLSQEEGV